MLWGHTIDFWDLWGFRMMIAGGVLGLLALAASLGSSFILYRVSSEQNKIIVASAAATEERLLSERRLTANERWRLERVEKIVLPRVLTQQQHQEMVTALRGTLSSINLFFGQSSEITMYALAIRQALEEAGIKVAFQPLPPGVVQSGVSTYFVNKSGRDFSEKLWRSAAIGGGAMGMVPMNLQGIVPSSENALIVGINDAVVQPQAGQPGEGIDARGVPVPKP